MNDRFLNAVSISRAIRVRCARAPGFQARVLHAFPRALNLLVLGSEGLPDTVVALVDPTVGDGPLNVVVSAVAPFSGVSAGAMARGDGRRLHVDGLTIALDDATVWEPRWPWERRSQGSVVSHHELRSPQSMKIACPMGEVSRPSPVRLGQETSANSRGQPQPPDGSYFQISSHSRHAARTAQKAAADLRDALYTGDRRGLAEAAASLAGLGPGLTPAGDDFLAGVMWGLRFRCAWLDAWDVDALCDVVVDAAVPRTTPLSAALLRAAAAGLADARWHTLFDALDRGEDTTAALQAVLAQGATSGADAWAGFQIPNPKLQIPITSLPT